MGLNDIAELYGLELVVDDRVSCEDSCGGALLK